LRIKRLSLVEGAKQAAGLTVVIDVFRAFTTDAYVMANGAERIYPVATVEEAFELKKQHPAWILMGERGGKQVPGFDYGNSPYDVKDVDFTGSTVIQTTSAGTQGLFNAYGADEILPGSFVMADAIVDYIKARNPETISLVAMGWGGREIAPEDESLAEYIMLKLQGDEPDFSSMKDRIRAHPQGAKFFDQAQPLFKEADFHCAMDINRFSFCLKLVKANQPYIVKALKG
jgi:2-phosphosulfolactate phosphatase